MASIVFGLIAMCIGLWGVVSYWYLVSELLYAIVPVVLLFGGFVALMAGIKKTGLKGKMMVSKKPVVDETTMNDKQ